MASSRAPPAADVAGAAASGRRDEAASFSSVWGGRGSEVGEEMSPRLGCAMPQGFSASLKIVGPPRG